MQEMISIIPKEGTDGYVLTIIKEGLRISSIPDVLEHLKLSKMEMFVLFDIYNIALINDDDEFIIKFNGKSTNTSTGIIPHLETILN